jgi:Flp pilus assembly protein TadB
MKLTEKTSVPIGWVFALLSCSGGALILAMTAMLWLSNVANTAENAKSDVSKQESKLSKTDESLQNIDRRLANIEGALHIKPYEASGK